jgi:hypothetical protein
MQSASTTFLVSLSSDRLTKSSARQRQVRIRWGSRPKRRQALEELPEISIDKVLASTGPEITIRVQKVGATTLNLLRPIDQGELIQVHYSHLSLSYVRILI